MTKLQKAKRVAKRERAKNKAVNLAKRLGVQGWEVRVSMRERSRLMSIYSGSNYKLWFYPCSLREETIMATMSDLDIEAAQAEAIKIMYPDFDVGLTIQNRPGTRI